MTAKILPELTQTRLKEMFHYNPDTGIFTTRVARGNVKEGAVADYRNSGYICIMIDRRYYKAHRLAWFYVHGTWPTAEIDHINHQRDDNRLCNLREVTKSENSKNLPRDPRNTSGHTGVYWRKDKQKFHVTIKDADKNRHVGYFASLDDAVAAREYLEKEYGYHVNHGHQA